ncbi:MAG: ribonuclease P protein component [Chloroflexi bacterium]|nr:MAG: ribonuclease P protein component [Chloroflexota bacterium]
MRRRLRLRSSRDFDRVLRAGRRMGTACLTAYVRDNESGLPRIGLAVSRRLGNAVVRNRIKRRLRARRSRAGRDVVIVARAGAIEADAARLGDEVNEVWQKAVERP